MANTVNAKVLHIICSSGFYGAERVVANLCTEITGVEQSVMCLTPTPDAVATFKAKVEYSGKTFISIPNSIEKALSHLKAIVQEKPVTLHAHGYKEIVIACIFAMSARSGCSIVVTQHGFTERNLKSKLYNFIDKACCRWGPISTVICVSDIIYSLYGSFGVPQSRLLLLQNGVSAVGDVNKQRARNTIDARYGLNPEIPIILYAGRLSTEKDPLLFVAAMASLQHKGVPFYALIAGEGPLETEIKTAIIHANLNQHVFTLGFVTDMGELLEAANILMLTSQTEGTPMILLEAMTRETLVVSASVGGIPDIIQHNENGYLVNSRNPKDFSDQCETLLKGHGQLTATIDRARATVSEKFSLDHQIPQYLQIYGATH